MKRAILGVLAASVIAAAVLVPSLALGDKTVTYLTAGSEVVSLNFEVSSGQVRAAVCGHAPQAGGGFGRTTCYFTNLTSGAIFTAVNSLATGAGLTFWQAQEGL